jgi:hypothetical protein
MMCFALADTLLKVEKAVWIHLHYSHSFNNSSPFTIYAVLVVYVRLAVPPRIGLFV